MKKKTSKRKKAATKTSRSSETTKARKEREKIRKTCAFKAYCMDEYDAYIEGKRGGPDKRGDRLRALASKVGVGTGTIKNMYLYGQGTMENWLKGMDFIKKTSQDELIKFYDSFPAIQKKLNKFSEDEHRMLKNMARMSKRELHLVNVLVETGLELEESIGK